jgi:hypothetical protein
MRKLIFGSLIAATLAGVSLPAAARTSVDFSLNFGPPVAPVEFVPAPRPGYVWVPGYYDWRFNRHHWVKGHWVRHRPGYHYRAARWRDADQDGVPNRYDRAPYNPNGR